MPDLTFDNLSRLAATQTSRRRAGAVLGGLFALATGIGAASPVAEAAPKRRKQRPNRISANKAKKCKKAETKCGKKCCSTNQRCVSGACKRKGGGDTGNCLFTKTNTTWTLKENCTLKRTLELPAGVTLDGNNRTMTFTGKFTSIFDPSLPLVSNAIGEPTAAGILVADGPGTVRNLTLDLKGLVSPGEDNGQFVGIVFAGTDGTVEHVRIEANQAGAACINGVYGFAEIDDRKQMNINDLNFIGATDVGLFGIKYGAFTSGTVANSVVEGANIGISLLINEQVSISASQFRDNVNGIAAWPIAGDHNTQPRLNVNTSTCVGRPGPSNVSVGILLLRLEGVFLAGLLRGNAISSYAYGIYGYKLNDLVVLQDNTFPAPGVGTPTFSLQP